MRIPFVVKHSILDPNNRLLTLARQGQHQPTAMEAIAVVLVMLALVIAGESQARLALRSIFPDGIRANTGAIVENVLGFLPVYLGMWAWLRWSSKRPFWSLGFERQGALGQILGGALAAGLMIAVTAGLVIIPGASLAPGELQTAGLAAVGIGLSSLLAYFVQSSAEEVLFRGWLLPVIGSRYRPWIGVLVSTLVFSLAHLPSTGLTPLAPLELLNLFLFGAFAAVLALAQGSLWGACAWHAVWNWAQGAMLGFALSGGAHEGILISIRATGPDIITGGAFGPDGGLAATAVFVIAIGVVSIRTRRNGQRA